MDYFPQQYVQYKRWKVNVIASKIMFRELCGGGEGPVGLEMNRVKPYPDHHSTAVYLMNFRIHNMRVTRLTPWGCNKDERG